MSIDEPFKSEDGAEDGSYLQIADTRSGPDESFERNEIIVRVTAALAHLPEHSQKVIIMREFHGASYEEIAFRTQTEINTVKSRISKSQGQDCKLV